MTNKTLKQLFDSTSSDNKIYKETALIIFREWLAQKRQELENTEYPDVSNAYDASVKIQFIRDELLSELNEDSQREEELK